MSQSPRRFTTLRALAWSAYLLVLLGVAEGATRMLQLVPPLTPQPDIAITLHYDDPNGLVRMRPGARYFTAGTAPMVISADGLRDREYSRTPPPGTTRIAIVGDSFTMGDGVVVEDSYPDQLEAMVSEGDRAVEVLNFGISATNTLQQVEIIRHTVLPYAPHVVVVAFNLNDYTVYTRTSFERMADRFGLTYRVNSDQTVQVITPPRTRMESLKNAVATRFALSRLVAAALANLRNAEPAPSISPRVAGFMQGVVPADDWDRVNRALLDMRTLVEDSGARFAVMILPAMTELPRPLPASFADYPFTQVHRRLGGVLDEAGVPWLDVLQAFGAQNIDELTVSRFDPHFNRAGNAIIAGALHDFLRDYGIIR